MNEAIIEAMIKAMSEYSMPLLVEAILISIIIGYIIYLLKKKLLTC